MFARFRFLVDRLPGRETALARYGVPVADLSAEVAGRDVALVGNARALAAGQSGGRIDAAGLVIRINRAPMPSARSHGTRTDWLALATSIGGDGLRRIGATRHLWMSHKRKRLPFAVATSPGFYLHPLQAYDDLKKRLGAPPTTGLMLIDLLSMMEPRSVTLYGFDFMQSLSLTGSRTAAQVPHDFAAEKAFVAALLARDSRFTICDG
jgi:hypothetical protein